MSTPLSPRRLTTVLARSAALLPLSASIHAQDTYTESAEKLIDYRQAVMDAMSGLTGILSGQVRDGLPAGRWPPAVASGDQAAIGGALRAVGEGGTGCHPDDRGDD